MRAPAAPQQQNRIGAPVDSRSQAGESEWRSPRRQEPADERPRRRFDEAASRLRFAAFVGDRLEGAFDIGGPVTTNPNILYRVVGLAREAVLIALEALSEVVLLHQPALHQEIQGAVDGGLPDSFARLAEAPLDVVHREVLVGAEDGVGHRLPLRGDGEPLLAQVAPEEANEGVKGGGVGGHGPGSRVHWSRRAWRRAGSPATER